jgi:hypothetical protein
MNLQSGNCPTCGGSEIQALPGGSLRCSHCGNYFADASRKSADPPSVHVHVHGVPQSGPVPAPQYAPQQYAPQPYAPQYATPPAGYYPPPQRKSSNGCLIAFIVIFLLGVVGFIGLALIGYAAEQAGTTPYSTPASPYPGGSSDQAPATTGKSFDDMINAINASNTSSVQSMLDADPGLANRSGRATIYGIAMNSATPLHVAAFNGNLDIVRLLLAKGADPNATAWAEDGSGHAATPLDLAEEMGHQQVATELYNSMYGRDGG